MVQIRLGVRDGIHQHICADGVADDRVSVRFLDVNTFLQEVSILRTPYFAK